MKKTNKNSEIGAVTMSRVEIDKCMGEYSLVPHMKKHKVLETIKKAGRRYEWKITTISKAQRVLGCKLSKASKNKEIWEIRADKKSPLFLTYDFSLKNPVLVAKYKYCKVNPVSFSEM